MLRLVEGVLQDLYRFAHAPEKTERILLALHAALTRQMRMPCCWLPRDRTEWPAVLTRLFGGFSESLESDRNKILRSEGLCPENLVRMRGQDLETALQMTEETLQELLGQGCVYYDCRRFSPFCEEEDLLEQAHQAGVELPLPLENSLHKRRMQAERLRKGFAQHLRRPSDILWPCAWLDSLRGKINRAWVLRWGLSENYWTQDLADPISSLILTDNL